MIVLQGCRYVLNRLGCQAHGSASSAVMGAAAGSEWRGEVSVDYLWLLSCANRTAPSRQCSRGLMSSSGGWEGRWGYAVGRLSEVMDDLGIFEIFGLEAARRYLSSILAAEVGARPAAA